jgi:hypothetical protein
MVGMRTMEPWEFDPVTEYDDFSDWAALCGNRRDARHEGGADVLFRSLFDDPDLEAPASVWRQ